MKTTDPSRSLRWQIERTLAACRDHGLPVNREHMRSLFGRMLDYHSIVYWAEPVSDRPGARSDAKNGAGFDADVDQADISGLAECLERHCLFNVMNDAPIRAAEQATDLPTLAEDRWPTFAPWQLQDDAFPHTTYRAASVRTWALAEGIGTPSIRVPASLVWQRAFPDRFMPIVSSGTACHSDLDQLLSNALFEVVERDGFMIAWGSRASPPGIAPDSAWLDDDVAGIADFCRHMGMTLALRDLTTDLDMPTVLAMIVDDTGRRPALSVGAATRATLASAASKAAKEAYQCWCWMSDEHARLTDSYEAVFRKLCMKPNMFHHPMLYGFPQASALAAPLLQEPTRWTTENRGIAGSMSSESAADAIFARCVDHLRQAGYAAYKVALTPNERVFGGLQVMRILIPGLVPLGIGDRAYCMGHPRIHQVPETRGWPTQGDRRDACPPPHPFP